MYFKCLLLLCLLGSIEGYYRRSDAQCPYRTLLHGRVRMRQRMKFAEFKCSPRYTLVGNKYATCINGQWDVPKPVCVRAGCNELPEVKNSIFLTSADGAWVNYFCLPGYKLDGSAVLYCDGRDWNSSVPQCVDSLQSQSLTSCDFEDEQICGWRQDVLHDFDWKRFNRETPSSFFMTGPSSDHTYGVNGTGYYMYIESTGRAKNSSARLLSPVYDSSLAKDGCFMFYYHMFGRATGGLRVYQKPDSVDIGSLRFASMRQKYLLFEKWGEQGNFWFDSVSPLHDFEEDFQIVIEGIRGDTFTSDIAIDDVAILQGENCTEAMKVATTPEPTSVDSCEGRCEEAPLYQGQYNCGCNVICLVYHDCCQDYLDICEYGTNSSVTDDPVPDSTPVELPQTQRLVANRTMTTVTYTTTPRTTPVTTKTKAATTTTTTTRRPTTSTTRTTPKPTTRSTTARQITTTLKTIPSTSTTRRYTTPKVTKTTKVYTSTTIRKITTSSKSTTTYKPTTVTEAIKSTLMAKPTRNAKIGANDSRVSASSGSNATVIVVALVAVCGVLLLVGLAATRARRFALVAQLRGRIRGESEVRYLTRAEDD